MLYVGPSRYTNQPRVYRLKPRDVMCTHERKAMCFSVLSPVAVVTVTFWGLSILIMVRINAGVKLLVIAILIGTLVHSSSH